MAILLAPFVWILQLFYDLFQNYGMALIVFAVVVKFLLFPVSLKSKRSMIQMNMLNGEMQKLQKMYGNNKERYNQEVQKLYEREKVNPMGGCLWSFVPLLILIPLYAIIREPMSNMMHMASEAISQVATQLNWATVAVEKGWVSAGTTAYSGGGYLQLYLSSLITPDKVDALRSSVEGAQSLFSINFDFLGISLAEVPQLAFWEKEGGFGLFLLPVVSAVSSIAFSMISMKTNAINQKSREQNKTNKSMLWLSPIMSLWIGFSMPAALCLYWIAQNLVSMVQEVLASKMLKKDYEKAAAEAERRAAEEKEEERQRKEEQRQERARRIEEEKANKGKKKGSPRKEGEAPSGPDREASRVGIRAYARGRAYDPYRFSPQGPTGYPGGESTVLLPERKGEAPLSQTPETEEKAESLPVLPETAGEPEESGAAAPAAGTGEEETSRQAGE